MIDQTFSVTRTKATWKPRVAEDDLPFFLNSDNTLTFLGVAGSEPAHFEGGGRAPAAILPYDNFSAHLANEKLSMAETHPATSLPEGVGLDYRIVGGFNNNTLEVSWKIDENVEYRLSWVAVKTFTGLQLKYVLPKKRSPLLFAFADEDAYAYCDESPCLECIFMCKRGFIIYAAIEDWGIARMPLDRATATGKTETTR